MKLLKKWPIDFQAIAKESGMTRGKLVRSPRWGWGVQNTQGVELYVDFGCITPPETEEGQLLKIEDERYWCIYAME